MKDGTHPEYHPVVFIDAAAGTEFVTNSCAKSKETRDIDGVTHYVIKCDITSASHPFYTGKQRFLDTKGRLDRFKKRYQKKSGGDAEKAE